MEKETVTNGRGHDIAAGRNDQVTASRTVISVVS